MEWVWGTLPYFFFGARAHYSDADQEAVNIGMPSTRTDVTPTRYMCQSGADTKQWEFETMQALVNLMCGLYAYVALLGKREDAGDTGIQTTKAGHLFATVDKTHSESQWNMFGPDRRQIEQSLGQLKAFARDRSTKSWTSPAAKPIQPFSVLWEHILQIQHSLQVRRGGVQQVSTDLLKVCFRQAWEASADCSSHIVR